MAAPATEELRELERLLTLASDEGRAVPLATLREELGVGSTADLLTMLGVLREHGKAVEESPGEWRGPTMLDDLPLADAEGRMDDEGRVRVRVGQDEPEAAAESRPEWLDEGVAVATVRLTFGIAAALDAAALGALVKAGIEEAHGRNEPFVLEVVS